MRESVMLAISKLCMDRVNRQYEFGVPWLNSREVGRYENCALCLNEILLRIGEHLIAVPPGWVTHYICVGKGLRHGRFKQDLQGLS